MQKFYKWVMGVIENVENIAYNDNRGKRRKPAGKRYGLELGKLALEAALKAISYTQLDVRKTYKLQRKLDREGQLVDPAALQSGGYGDQTGGSCHSCTPVLSRRRDGA